MNRAPSCRECHREMNETREKREKERNILRSGVRMYTRHNAFKWSCAIENGHARRCQRSLTKEQDHSAGNVAEHHLRQEERARVCIRSRDHACTGDTLLSRAKDAARQRCNASKRKTTWMNAARVSSEFDNAQPGRLKDRRVPEWNRSAERKENRGKGTKKEVQTGAMLATRNRRILRRERGPTGTR
ncbi:uncharacterized protein LOC143151697 [Ptiloglossa arizonensis]|uniref:uncharacterized protein LOC143151697 n=1 Tax=Ptiloglossa arizonensis TaxID=3350558 RepID=UPI003FA0D074